MILEKRRYDRRSGKINGLIFALARRLIARKLERRRVEGYKKTATKNLESTGPFVAVTFIISAINSIYHQSILCQALFVRFNALIA